MFRLDVDICCQDSIEVVLKPFETNFQSPDESATTTTDAPADTEEKSGLLQSSVNIRRTRRQSFKCDEAYTGKDKEMEVAVKLPNLESTKTEMVTIDQKIQALLKKYKKPDSESNLIKSVSTVSTCECDSLSSVGSSFSDDDETYTEELAPPVNTITTRRSQVLAAITSKSLGAVSLRSLESKQAEHTMRPLRSPLREERAVLGATPFSLWEPDEAVVRI